MEPDPFEQFSPRREQPAPKPIIEKAVKIAPQAVSEPTNSEPEHVPEPPQDLKHAKRQRLAIAEPSRQPPNSPEAEEGVLGCILLSPIESLTECLAKKLAIDAFYDLRRQEIFKAIIEMSARFIAVDLVTLHQTLKDKNILEDIGGIPYLAKLPDCVPSAANLSYYLDIVTEKHSLRKAIGVCSKFIGGVYEHTGEVDTLFDGFERDVLQIRDIETSKEISTKELATEAINKIEELHQRQGAISGISTGLADLDFKTDGLHKGRLYLVAAYPKSGKTSLALGIMDNATVNQKLAAGIFSVEMTARELMMQLICARARVNLMNVQKGLLVESDFPKLSTAARQLSNSKLFIDDSATLTLGELRAKARRMKQRHDIKLLMIDYLQLVSNPSGKSNDNREREISSISKGIKAMAKELDLPIILLSQLNEDGSTRESRAPEQDCNSLWLLKKQEKEEEIDREVCNVTLRIKLNRHGPTGNIDLIFLKIYTKFESVSKMNDADVPKNQYNDD